MSLRHRLCVCLRAGARMYVSRVPLFAGGHRTCLISEAKAEKNTLCVT